MGHSHKIAAFYDIALLTIVIFRYKSWNVNGIVVRKLCIWHNCLRVGQDFCGILIYLYLTNIYEKISIPVIEMYLTCLCCMYLVQHSCYHWLSVKVNKCLQMSIIKQKELLSTIISNNQTHGLHLFVFVLSVFYADFILFVLMYWRQFP
jgi:hypothetical protein